MSASSAAIILSYDMSDFSADVATLVTGSDLTAGSNASILIAGPAAPDNFATAPVLTLDPVGGSTNPTVAFNNGRLFFVDMTVSGSTTDLDLTDFSIDAAKNGASSRNFGVFFQVDTGSGFGSATAIVASQALTATRNSIASYTYDLTGFASLQDLTAGNVVRFSVSMDNDFSASFDNLVIEGTGTAIPEANASLIAAAGLALFLVRRRA